jgi:hypothetical protein
VNAEPPPGRLSCVSLVKVPSPLPKVTKISGATGREMAMSSWPSSSKSPTTADSASRPTSIPWPCSKVPEPLFNQTCDRSASLRTMTRSWSPSLSKSPPPIQAGMPPTCVACTSLKPVPLPSSTRSSPVRLMTAMSSTPLPSKSAMR